jgi:hypothetical protein
VAAELKFRNHRAIPGVIARLPSTASFCILARLKRKKVMLIRRLMVPSALALLASMCASHAGPCLQEIDRLQPRVDAKLDAIARAGPSGSESLAALLHRQPTPGSIAAAESKLGEIAAEAIAAAMSRAREADRGGNQSACDRALAEVQRLLGP